MAIAYLIKWSKFSISKLLHCFKLTALCKEVPSYILPHDVVSLSSFGSVCFITAPLLFFTTRQCEMVGWEYTRSRYFTGPLYWRYEVKNLNEDILDYKHDTAKIISQIRCKGNEQTQSVVYRPLIINVNQSDNAILAFCTILKPNFTHSIMVTNNITGYRNWVHTFYVKRDVMLRIVFKKWRRSLNTLDKFRKLGSTLLQPVVKQQKSIIYYAVFLLTRHKQPWHLCSPKLKKLLMKTERE